MTNLDKYSTIQNCERVEGLSGSHCEQGIALKACAPPSPISIISLTPSSSLTVQSSPSLSFSGLAQSRGVVAHPGIRKPNVHNRRQHTCCIFYHIAYILNISNILSHCIHIEYFNNPTQPYTPPHTDTPFQLPQSHTVTFTLQSVHECVFRCH